MYNAIIILVSYFWVIVLKYAASLSTDCLDNPNDVQSYTGTTSVTHTGKTCQRWDTDYPHLRSYRHFSEPHNYCRAPDNYHKLWCYTLDENTRWESCDIPQCGLSTETVTVTNTQATSATFVSGIGHIDKLSTETVTVKKTQATSATSVSAAHGTDCFNYKNGIPSYTGTTSVTHTGKTCQRWDSQSPHTHNHGSLSEHQNYCRNPSDYKQLWCYTMTDTRWEYCDIQECGLSTEAVTVINTQTTSEMSVSTGIENIGTNGEWSIWNDWKFCEVNCVREDTTEGTQRRWRTCNGSDCSGDDIEERACSESDICKGMRPRKLLCKCPKRFINTKWHNLDGKNIKHSEVKEKVLEDFNKNIKSEISVDKKTVTKEVRKKISSVNKRQSSQPIGWGCIVFMGLPTFFLIAMDLINCYIHFRARCVRKKRNRITAISGIPDHGYPLQ